MDFVYMVIRCEQHCSQMDMDGRRSGIFRASCVRSFAGIGNGSGQRVLSYLPLRRIPMHLGIGMDSCFDACAWGWFWSKLRYHLRFSNPLIVCDFC
jgi:hypothetical protein